MAEDAGIEAGAPGDRAPEPGAPRGMPGNPLTLTDPGMMRALAHPARLAILFQLGLDGPATATECASVTDLSPSACSYHLRTLARYGLVEEDISADGRERPWRAKVVSFTVPDSPDTPPAARAAGELVVESTRAKVDEVRERYRDRRDEYPADWQEAGGFTHDALHVTADELSELRRRVQQVIGEYRRLDRAERPPGAKRVQAIAEFTPWFSPEEA